MDHEGISPFGNKFDIRLEVRTQNGSVVRKSKMFRKMLYLQFQLQFHIIAQTFLILSLLPDLYFIFVLLPPFCQLPVKPHRSILSYETQTYYLP